MHPAMYRTTLTLCVISWLLVATPLVFAGSRKAIVLEPGRKQLFLDDFVVQEKSGLERTMHRLGKRGLVLKADRAWEKGRVWASSAPIWVEKEQLYKWVYRPSYKNWSGLAVSKDGIHWTKPMLGLVAFEGSKQNSIFSDRRIQKVVHDPDDPDPARRYKGLAGSTPVVSPDLVHWRDAGPPLGGGDSGSLTYDHETKLFLTPLKISDHTKETYRAFELVTSNDFRHWTEPSYFFGADEGDQRKARDFIRRWLSDPARPRPLFVEPPPWLGWTPPEAIRSLPKRRHSWNAQCQNISVFPYHGLYIGLATMLYPTGAWLPGHENTSAFFLVQLVMTRDLKTWTRLGDREPFLSPARLDKGFAHNYERMLVQAVNRPIVRGDELWFYYNGAKEHQDLDERYATYMDGTRRHPSTLSEIERQDLEAGHSAIYLAALRLDGFISLGAGETGGYVLTKPLKLGGKRVFLNVAVEKGGSAKVAIQDPSGKLFPGHSLAEAVAITADQVRQRVRWKKEETVEKLAGQTVQLKIQLKKASLYALWTE